MYTVNHQLLKKAKNKPLNVLLEKKRLKKYCTIQPPSSVICEFVVIVNKNIN